MFLKQRSACKGHPRVSASLAKDVTLLHSACKGRRSILHALRLLATSHCRANRLKAIVQFRRCVAFLRGRTEARQSLQVAALPQPP